MVLSDFRIDIDGCGVFNFGGSSAVTKCLSTAIYNSINIFPIAPQIVGIDSAGII